MMPYHSLGLNTAGVDGPFESFLNTFSAPFLQPPTGHLASSLKKHGSRRNPWQIEDFQKDCRDMDIFEISQWYLRRVFDQYYFTVMYIV